MQRKAMKQGRSVKRVNYDEEFAAAKVLVKERSRGVCEAATFVLYHLDRSEDMRELVEEFLKIDCGFRAVHTHHRKYRSRGGTNQLANLIDLCEQHHSYAHAFGGFDEPANRLGLSLSSGELEIW